MAGTGSGGAEPESSEVVKKKRKKSKKNKLNWIEYTEADLDETPLFVVKLGKGENDLKPYPEEIQKSYDCSTRT